MNRPVGKAKQREVKGPPTKPYVERDDGQNFARFNALAAALVRIPPEQVKTLKSATSRTTKKAET
jgi:hypothetical protein